MNVDNQLKEAKLYHEDLLQMKKKKKQKKNRENTWDLLHKNIPKIFVITTIETKDDKNFPIKNTRSVGWFPTFNIANQIVINNICDIWETSYNYAVIEEVEWGLYSMPGTNPREFWYEFDKKEQKYFPINKPKIFEKICAFSLG